MHHTQATLNCFILDLPNLRSTLTKAIQIQSSM